MGDVVGFDLDMTLLDTRPGIAATYHALVARTGVDIDVDLVVNRLGPRLTAELANWFPQDEVAAAVRLYRDLYPTIAIELCLPLPGARDAVDAAVALGADVVVITGKLGQLARLHLDHCGFPIDTIIGDVFAAGKEQAMRTLGVEIYVGDHVADMRAANAAGPGITAVGVCTGPCDRDQLTAAGAHVTFADLTEFPRWLRAHQGAIR